MKGHTIQRILVAVDASEDSEAALQAAARLAALVGAELCALYVEDENLLRLSKLRFARQVDPVSGADRTLEPGEVQTQIRAEAERLRAVVERLAGSLRIEWTFRTSRGRVIHELLTASAGADVVTVGLTGRSPGVRAGSTFLGIVRTGDRPVLVARRGARLGHAIHVLHDGSEAGAQALAVAEALARAGKRPLMVFLLRGRVPATTLAQETRAWLRSRKARGAVVHLSEGGAPVLARLLKEEGCGLLVMPRGPAGGQGDADLSSLLEEIGCPVLLID